MGNRTGVAGSTTLPEEGLLEKQSVSVDLSRPQSMPKAGMAIWTVRPPTTDLVTDKQSRSRRIVVKSLGTGLNSLDNEPLFMFECL